jgi:flavin-dependent dehydrogenase
LIEDGSVRGVRIGRGGDELRAQVVIGADGGESVIARSLRTVNRPDEHQAIAIRGYLDGFDERPNQVEFFLLNDILPGYAWIFPIGKGLVNVGIGMRLDEYKKRGENLKELFGEFLQLPQVRKRATSAKPLRDAHAWPLKLASTWYPLAFDGAVLVGDAAGLINPLTGGGIHNAVFSAGLAGKVVDESLRAGDVTRKSLAVYESRCRAGLRASTGRATWIQRQILPRPRIVDGLVRASSAWMQNRRGTPGTRSTPSEP